MILDRETQVSDGQAITATAVSTDTIDLGVAGRDISNAEHFSPFAQVRAAFNNLTSLEFQIIESANANLSSHVVLATTGAIPLASLVAGAVIQLPKQLPRTSLRFLGFRYVVAGTAPTAGSVDAGFVMALQTNKRDF